MMKVRFAPSPTGVPHIGNTRTALFDYLLARKNKGIFILRIEDTDQKRLVEGAEEKIEEILDWLGISPDEKLKQSERLDTYKKYAKELVEKGVAYEKDGAIYVKVPDEKKLSWTDAVGNKQISFEGKDVEDFVVLKSDGYPTYHLASVVDDHLTEITHVIRGEEWISSVPKHLFIYESLGWKPPVFVHLPVILSTDKSKLSKRHGAKSVLELRDEGYLKEAIINFMALLGWNPGGDKEVMSLEEMVNLFDLKDVNVSNPIFDIKKLDWMNGVWIRKLSVEELAKRVGSKDLKLVELAQSRMTTLNDFGILTNFFYEKPKIKLDQSDRIVVERLAKELSNVKTWKTEEILLVLKKVMIEEKVKMKVLYKIFTGSESGLPLPQSLEILGKEKTFERLNV
ncbi:MAG TPA: glutamate--tRNA ligase family protein [Patescibacteria group bacterium]|nr:glutamate--tRNA ligase family protein [Patescibacteria group bacterium]